MKELRSTQLRSLSLGLLLLAIVPHESRAQEKAPDDVIRINTDLVVFDAQVIDKKSKRVIGDLSKDDFEVTENGRKQTVTYFSRDELPLSIMLMLDVSGSVRPIIHQIRDGTLNALQRLKPEDQVAVMAFATSFELVQNFTKDRSAVSKKIEAATVTDRLGSATFLGPALESAATRMSRAPTPTSRRVIIIITDNVTFTEPRQAEDITEELFDNGTVVYGLIVQAALAKAVKILSLGKLSKGVNRFVEETGGEIIGAAKKEVDTKLGVVIDRLRARYTLGFRPTNATDDEKFRPVEIKVSQAKKRRERPLVLTKKGYYFRRRSA